ncbi:MAG TPA: type IV pili twitching motility protein PilT, partial [Desulfocapsa sulfexigens]|nr:type IV pili twitching motility protein PilT [Desulfocapsa sulfexigens]
MRTLDDSIMEFLDRRMISADDAYSNAVEKSNFLKFLRNPPSDFTEV